MDVDGKTWFRVKDVTNATGKGKPCEVVKNLDPDEKELRSIESTFPRTRSVWIVSEPGLYTLLLRSRDAVIREGAEDDSTVIRSETA